MPIIEKGPVRIRYEEAGSGPPILVLPGGGLNATVEKLGGPGSFDPLKELAGTHRCIALDIRNAPGGATTGPLEIERPWDAFTDDQLALLDHLGIDRCVVMGFCIGGPLAWNLIRRAPSRVIAAVMVHPSGHRPELPNQFYDNNIKGWAPELCAKRPEITQAMTEAFLDRMYRTGNDFLFTVGRDFVRGCRTPVLVMPDDIPPHPFAVAMESAMLAPNAQVSLYPWREPPARIPLALRHVRSFLAEHAAAQIAPARLAPA